MSNLPFRALGAQRTFAKARSEVLERFLRRSQIYFTPLFIERYEARAGANLVRALGQYHHDAS